MLALQERANSEAPPHRSVMLEEVLSLLCPQPGGVYCDATLGAGGHTEQILAQSGPDGRVFGIDRDRRALALAQARLGRFGDRFVPVHGRFGELAALLRQQGAPPLAGLVADLGVSSMQLDQADRGFSFQRRGPIDMRMDDGSGETALALIERLDVSTLADVLFHYGEERNSRRIAAGLKQAAAEGALTDTLALAEVVRRHSGPSGDHHKHPATRTFQALRIAVNDELRQLHQLLQVAPTLLAPGGRLVVLTFHSLEDRLTKQALKASPWRVLTKKAALPSQAELAQNPRSRSAQLRAAERVAQPASPPAAGEGAP
jgi:16S rRNA (cytosine1402-N4)-methyltransferase